jgi:hypothetical protein
MHSNTSERDAITVADFQAMAFRPAFLIFLAVSSFESLDLILSGRRTNPKP